MKVPMFTAIVLAGVTIGIGCDDSNSVPQSVLEQAKKASEAPKGPLLPTTQELVSGTRTRVALMPLPLTIEAPKGWGKLNDNNALGLKVSDLAMNILQGYAPNGEIQIQLSSRPLMKEEELQRIVEFGKKEMKEKPEIVKFELRDHGNIKVLERQRVGQPRPLALQDSSGVERTSTESNFSWTISALVPNEGAYQVFELNFIGLTKSQYDKDGEFLNGIMSTLHYAGDGSPAVATTLPATRP